MSVAVFEEKARALEVLAKAGVEVYVEGRLFLNTWISKDGQSRTTGLSVSAWRVEVLGRAEEFDDLRSRISNCVSILARMSPSREIVSTIRLLAGGSSTSMLATTNVGDDDIRFLGIDTGSSPTQPSFRVLAAVAGG